MASNFQNSQLKSVQIFKPEIVIRQVGSKCYLADQMVHASNSVLGVNFGSCGCGKKHWPVVRGLFKPYLQWPHLCCPVHSSYSCILSKNRNIMIYLFIHRFLFTFGANEAKIYPLNVYKRPIKRQASEGWENKTIVNNLLWLGKK